MTDDKKTFTIEEVESLLLSLMKGEFSSLTIGFNDANACNYDSVKSYLEDTGEDGCFISPEEREKAIETNRWWSIQWYPNTPVGFCRQSASSLVTLLQSIREGWLQ